MFVGAILILCGLLSPAFLLAHVHVNSSMSELGQGSAFNPQEPSSQELSSSVATNWDVDLAVGVEQPSWTMKLQLQDRDKRN